jgi:metal transporter CNNM
LLGNVAVNAALSILMADVSSGLVGFLLSTAIIVIFGEIIPQASCSRYALYIGAKTIPLTKMFIFILYPLAKPVSMGLDYALGEEAATVHSNMELMKMLQIHVEKDALDDEAGTIMTNAMQFKEKKVSEVMTPIDKVKMISVNDHLDFATVSDLFKSGYSRVPVYNRDRNDIVGLLLTKDLIVVDPEESITVRSMMNFFGRTPHKAWPDHKLGDMLKLFKQGRGHLALVHNVNKNEEAGGDPFYEVVGIVTLEDIIEEILGSEILDETDMFIHVEQSDKIDRETFDFARLRLLDSSHANELSADEVRAVTAHLMANVDAFSQPLVETGAPMDKDTVKMLVENSYVLTLKKGQKQKAMSRKSSMEMLYRRNKVDTFCTLILSGKMEILAGREGFVSEAGPWSCLASDALTTEQGKYTPDFSARVATDKVRCLRFNRTEFQKAVLETTRRASEVTEVENALDQAAAEAGDVVVNVNLEEKAE